jgi:hypothetical protein
MLLYLINWNVVVFALLSDFVYYIINNLVIFNIFHTEKFLDI